MHPKNRNDRDQTTRLIRKSHILYELPFSSYKSSTEHLPTPQSKSTKSCPSVRLSILILQILYRTLANTSTKEHQEFIFCTTYHPHPSNLPPNTSQPFNFNQRASRLLQSIYLRKITIMSAGSSPQLAESSQLAELSSTHSLPCPDPDCQLHFSNAGDLYGNYDGFHPLFIFLPGRAKQYKCSFCPKTYVSERRMRGHTNTHKPKCPGSAESRDQLALILQSHVAMADKQRSQAQTTTKNTTHYNPEHEDQGNEEQASYTTTQQDPGSLSSAQPKSTPAMADKQHSQAQTTTENTLHHNPEHEDKGSKEQASYTTTTQQDPDSVNSTQPNSTTRKLSAAQKKSRGSQLLAPVAEKAQRSRNLTTHKVIFDEMAVTEEGDLIDIGLTQSTQPAQAVRKMYRGNHATSHCSSAALGRPWEL